MRQGDFTYHELLRLLKHPLPPSLAGNRPALSPPLPPPMVHAYPCCQLLGERNKLSSIVRAVELLRIMRARVSNRIRMDSFMSMDVAELNTGKSSLLTSILSAS